MDDIELMDRVESAASTLSGLVARLDQSSISTQLVEKIANRSFVLKDGLKDCGHAGLTQAVIGVRLVSADTHLEGGTAFRE